MLSTHQARQRGFTLIELVVVIVIIGILAAFAIPRFANISTEARIAQLRGLAGTLRSTSALVHGISLARNVTNDSPATGLVQLEGTSIEIVNSYAAGTAAGVTAAINNLDVVNTYQATYAAGVATFQVRAAGTPANCSVTYTAAGAGTSAVVGAPIETGC